MKKSISITMEEEKISAIEMYLGQKDTGLETELAKFAEQLYVKTVPQNVRDYIDMLGERKPVRRPKKSKTTAAESVLAEDEAPSESV